MALDASRVISGTYGEVRDADGNWLTNVMRVEANVEVGLEEIKRAGTRWLGHKITSLKGTGTISGYMVTSGFVERISRVKYDNSAPYTTQLIVKLDDPESFGTYRVRLIGVMFDKIPLINYEVGAIVEQELSFVFSDYTFLDTI